MTKAIYQVARSIPDADINSTKIPSGRMSLMNDCSFSDISFDEVKAQH